MKEKRSKRESFSAISYGRYGSFLEAGKSRQKAHTPC
jgi:hypothetical protein